MPTLVIEGYKFRFYSSDFKESPHVHVIRAENVANIWLQPITVEYNYGYNGKMINRIVKLTEEHQDHLLEAWYDYFGR